MLLLNALRSTGNTFTSSFRLSGGNLKSERERDEDNVRCILKKREATSEWQPLKEKSDENQVQQFAECGTAEFADDALHL